MKREQVVKFETAKLAFEKGFNHMKANIYGDNLSYHRDEPEGAPTAKDINTTVGNYLAPTLSRLQQWLREVHKIHASALPCYDEESNQILWVNTLIDMKDIIWEEIEGYTYYHSFEEVEE